MLLWLLGCTPDVSVTKVDIDNDTDGYTADVDCDDANKNTYPHAPETCDGLDNDCDDTIDEEPIDAPTRYSDQDGDGVGDALAPPHCEAQAGEVTQTGDCDDENSEIHPGATEICNGLDDDCDGETDTQASDAPTWYQDSDQDGWGVATLQTTSCTQPEGYSASEGDCDDTDPSRSLDAQEVCNGIDDDCDLQIDDEDSSILPDSQTTWFIDVDGDGAGSAQLWVLACEAPPNYVEEGTDCDDQEPLVYQGTTESCDGLDNDCDGQTDEAGSTGELTWYLDFDGDGVGGSTFVLQACEQPTGYSVQSTDCNDGDATISPLQAEVCDSSDNNCNGQTDEGVLSQFYQDSDSDGFGDASILFEACSQPPGYVTDASDCDDTHNTSYPGATEVCGDGIDQSCDGLDESCIPLPTGIISDTDADMVFTPNTTGYLGYWDGGVVSGDLNGDGQADLAVTATLDADLGAGVVYLISGPINNDGNIATLDYARISTQLNYPMPLALSANADLTGDGRNDVLIRFSSGYGALAIIPGTVTGEQSVHNASALGGVQVTWNTESGAFTAQPLDWNGDGQSDLAVSLLSGVSNEQIAVLTGPLTSQEVSTSAHWLVPDAYSANPSGYQLGASLAGGDLDGDGMDELVASDTDDETVFICWGGASGISTLAQSCPDSVTGIFTSFYGYPTAILADQDYDGDGTTDLAISLYDVASSETHIFYTPPIGSADIATSDVKILHSGSYTAGWNMDAADINSDDKSELLIFGVYGSTGCHFCGDIWMYTGLDQGGTLYEANAAALYQGTTNPFFGYSGNLVDDVTGDGAMELLVGGPDASNDQRLYLFELD